MEDCLEYVEVHPRVLERHPQLTEEDVRRAWDTAFVEAARVGSPNWPEYLRVGFDDKGREVEMVAAPYKGGWIIYHANTPLSKRTRDELKRCGREL